jgi:hypothetical protein
MQSNSILDFKCLLGFNLLATVRKNYKYPEDQFIGLNRLANKIGGRERPDINQDVPEDIGR